MSCISGRTNIKSFAPLWAMSRSLIQISPESGFSSRATHLATVDFPDPELPTIANVLPRGISKETLLAAASGARLRNAPRRVQYFLPRFRTRSRTSDTLLEEIGSIGMFEATHPVGMRDVRFGGILR